MKEASEERHFHPRPRPARGKLLYSVGRTDALRVGGILALAYDTHRAEFLESQETLRLGCRSVVLHAINHGVDASDGASAKPTTRGTRRYVSAIRN
jgi:hypothetical protein